MRKITNKAVSVILVMALCVSTIWGALIPASAATTGTYLIETDSVASGSKVITYEVTLTNPSGLTSGTFDLMLGKDVIDDVNFDANGNYIDPVNETLEDFRGTEIKTFNGNWKPTGNSGYYVTAPTGTDETKWEQTGNIQAGVWSDVSNTTVWSIDGVTDINGNALTSDATTRWEKLESRSGVTATEGVTYKWVNTSTATRWTMEGEGEPVVTKERIGYFNSNIPAQTSTTRWVYVSSQGEGTFLSPLRFQYQEQKKWYAYQKQTKSSDKYEYQELKKLYDITYEGGRDKDGNFMIAGTNVYKTVDVYDEEGNKTGTEKVVDYVIKENEGNKGTLLPNVFDDKIGLYDTKIEITGGTRLDGSAFSISDFTNDSFETFAKSKNNTTNAIYAKDTAEGADGNLVIDDDNDGRKYIYNMTDNYKLTHYNSNPVTYEKITDAEGKETYYTIQDINLLDKYYREYTTVDVATANLGYKISTVSEDNVGSTYQYTQYAQGFKDINFNSSAAYSSITFTVTLDFSGNCDRRGANAGVDEDKLTKVVNGTNCRNTDGHWAGENYVQYDKKYQLNFLSDDAALSTYTAEQSGSGVNYAHVHEGLILEETGLADPLNKEAIDALLAKNPNAKEGVDYFELYDAKCQKCGQITPMIAAPDLPYKVTSTADDGVMVNAKGTKGQFGFNNFRNISGISLNYNDNGTVALNIHYPSKMDGEQMIITDENGMVLKYSDTIGKANDNTSIYSSIPSNYAGKKLVIDGEEVGRYEGYLTTDAQMISIDNLSAKEVDQTLYIARYTPSSSTETQLMGITHAISVADYCSEVIKGNNVYYLEDDNYSESTVAQDKAVAAAFINYAHASKNALVVNTNDYVERTVDLLEFGDYLVDDLGSTSKWYDTKLADNGETGDSWENAIIIDSAEEFVYLAKASGNDTKGKYYKVADNIAGFNLATDKLDINGTLEDNLDIIKGSGKNHAGGTPGFQGHFDGNGATVYGAWTNDTWDTANNRDNTPNYAGLFSCTKGNVTIKNLNVRLSYFVAKNAAGAIVGYHTLTKNATEAKNETIASGKLVLPETGSLTIENCSVTDCYIQTKGTGWGTGVGAIVGQEDNTWSESSLSYVVTDTTNWTSTIEGVDASKIITTTNASSQTVFSRYELESDGKNTYANGRWDIRNCYVNLDPEYFISTSASTNGSTRGGVIAWSTTNGDVETKGANVQNCIVIGITPYTTNASATDNGVQHAGLEIHYQNVYTDQTAGSAVTIGGTLGNRNFTNRVYTLTTDQLTGLTASANMPKLDWDKTWCATESYPTLYAPYNVPDVNKTIYWDGTLAAGLSSSAKGTKDDPIIIYTAEELAYIVGQKDYAITDGKYFKIADTIANIVLQPESKAADIMALDSSAAVKTYFENGSGFKAWKNYGWEGSTFCGNIDFNGITIYGLYQKDSTNNAGLFSNVDAGAAIQNLTLTNSYMTSAAPDYQVAAIAAVSNSETYGGKKTNGIVWINHVTVANNYLYNASTDVTRSGVLAGSLTETLYTDNCFVYGNDATFGDGAKMPLINSAGNSIPSTVAGPDGLVTKIDVTEGGNFHFNMVRNSIILGCDPYDVTQGTGSRFNDARSYENVYTDHQAGTVTFKNGTLTFTIAQIKHVDVADLYGSGAKTIMPGLDWYDAMTNPDGVWYFGYNTAMPSLSKIKNTMPSDLQAAYDTVVFDTADTSGTGTEMNGPNGTMSFGVYQTALSLKANPYMSFAFAFHGDYKTNRDKIKVRFTYTQNGATKTTEEISVPAAVDANGDGKIDDIKNVDGWTNTFNNGRYHTYKAEQIPVEAMADGVKVEASYNGGEWKDLGTFSVEGLGKQFETAYNETPCEYYAVRVEAAKAFLFYVQQIKTRYGA